MIRLILLALLGCAFSHSLYAKATDRAPDNGWRSLLTFSGQSSHTRDGLDGRLGVAVDEILGEQQSLGLNFHDSKSNRDKNQSRALKLGFSFPLGATSLSLTARDYQYQHSVKDGDRRYDARNESSVLSLSGSRFLFSRYGIALNGVVNHTGRDTRTLEQGRLVTDGAYELSSLGVKGRWSQGLWAGLHASTEMVAMGGREYSASDYPLKADVDEEARFYKLSVNASLEREIFRWGWELRGRYQFADEDLPGSERVMVAGPSLLAGFNGQSLYTHEGGWLRMRTLSPPLQVPVMDHVLSNVGFSLLHGWAPYAGAADGQCGKAAGAQVSLRLTGRSFTANVSVGRMFRASSLAMAVPEHPDVRFSLSMGL
ncbi:ShlB/FhaC/HecB family hemolysin secretion/activation protein [Marinobacter sp. DUT-3]|uniref:ShlB/FhaC/HecB family hemolysin secretion/activation protein n=1 Tax=Marinobacter sp. DUT-3 TaxID=3412036 RepID=UPI003D17063A